MPAQSPACELLSHYFERKRRKTPGLSVRAVAGHLGVSASYVSRVLSGKKSIAPRLLPPIAQLFEMDELAVRKIQAALIREKLPEGFALPELTKESSKEFKKEFPKEFKDAEFPTYDLLKTWYQIALLDLISVKDFKPSARWIARRLRISPEQAKGAWKNLIELGVLRKKNGRWEKEERLLHFPTQRTDARVRQFHLQHLELAKQELQVRLLPEDFARRLIMGSTMAVNPENLPKARELLLETSQRVIELLTQGECSEVYHLNLALFPLTAREA